MPFEIERYMDRLPTHTDKFEPEGGLFSNRASREVAKLNNDTQIEAVRMANQAKLDHLEGEIHKNEVYKTLEDANELVDYSRALARGDDMKAAVFGRIVGDWAITTSARMRRRHSAGW